MVQASYVEITKPYTFAEDIICRITAHGLHLHRGAAHAQNHTLSSEPNRNKFMITFMDFLNLSGYVRRYHLSSCASYASFATRIRTLLKVSGSWVRNFLQMRWWWRDRIHDEGGDSTRRCGRNPYIWSSSLSYYSFYFLVLPTHPLVLFCCMRTLSGDECLPRIILTDFSLLFTRN